VASLEVENGDLRRRLGDVEAHLGLSTGMVLSFLCVYLCSHTWSPFLRLRECLAVPGSRMVRAAHLIKLANRREVS
jgi:hypothetical protein